MRSRYQVTNFFVTELSADHTLVIGNDGVLPLLNIPNIDEGKQFFVVLKPNDSIDRLVLPVYKD